MKKLLFVILLLTLPCFAAFSQSKVVFDFISCIKNQNRELLSDKIAYPLRREYPLPPVKNREEFLKRYNEIFDDSLVNIIITSMPEEDWKEVGWRGIMLQRGLLWLDIKGRLTAVNYQSSIEKQQRAELIDQQRNLLHPSLKAFKQPACLMETKKFRIRIDDMGNGNYRYASWELHNKQSDKPDLIIENGTFIPEGTGGNYHYDFKNDGYIYRCSVTVLGEKDSPPAELYIYKADKEILYQVASVAD